MRYSMPVWRIWSITETISLKNSPDRTSTTAASLLIPAPALIMVASVMRRRGGRLSTTYQFRSSSAAAARDRPAPDMPVIRRSSGLSAGRSGVCSSRTGIPSGTVVGPWAGVG